MGRIRILGTVGTHSHLCPAADPRFAYRGEDVAKTLERVCARGAHPNKVRVDGRSEFISRYLDLWANANDETLGISRPGKPTDRAILAPSFRG